MLNEYSKNRRVYPIVAIPADKNTTANPLKDGWESLNCQTQAMDNEGPIPIQSLIRWPDRGMNQASQSSHAIYPSENDERPAPTKKIHSFGLNEGIEDDQNDFGGLASVEDTADPLERAEIESYDRALAQGLANLLGGQTQYGPGNYPDDDEEVSQPGVYHNLLSEDKPQFNWLIPGILAIGPHPIFTSHLEDLSLLKEAGIKAVVSVFDKALDHKMLTDFRYLFIKTVEGFSSDLSTVCRFIDAQERLGNPVFIHSLSGKGRAATALAAYVVHKGWLTPVEAIEYMRQNYDESAIETTYQEDAILQLATRA